MGATVLGAPLSRIHANGTGVRHAIARALATANLAPSDATFRVARARVDLDRDGDVARAEVAVELLSARPLEDWDDLTGVVNPDGVHPLMVRLPGVPTAGLAPFFMDMLAVSWSRWLEHPPGGSDVTLPPGVDPLSPHVGSSQEEARAFAEAEGKALPTLAELRHAWGPRPLPWGDAPDPSSGRVGRPRYDQLPEGGALPPTPTGLLDLGAWLWQWVDDGPHPGGSVVGGAPWPLGEGGDPGAPAEGGVRLGVGAFPVGIRLVQRG